MGKASFFSRFVAYLVDGLAISFIAWGLALLFNGLFSITSNSNNLFVGILFGTLGVITFFAWLILAFLYFGYFWSKDGQSVGMKLTGIKVVRRDGGLQSYVRAALRGTVGYWISGLVFGLGFLWAAFDSEKEGWHDKIFDTWVVEAK